MSVVKSRPLVLHRLIYFNYLNAEILLFFWKSTKFIYAFVIIIIYVYDDYGDHDYNHYYL